MLSDMINYLKDPHLIAVIQEFFGVEIPKNTIEKNEENVLNLSQELTATKRNGISRDQCESRKTHNDDDVDDELNQINTQEISNYNLSSPVENRFWYYLFMFGTELGDETFYSAFIPFLFWNIDGVVGRKIVIIWAIVMTIGKESKKKKTSF